MRMARRSDPVRRVLAGAVAGAVGTVAMDLVWYARARRDGSDAGFAEWEIVGDLSSWDDAPAPGQMGRKVIAAVTNVDPPVEQAATISNAMHWVYGTSWAAAYALALPRRPWWAGPALGAAVWASDYVTLPLAGLYQPIWKYDAPTLAKDLSAHLVFGTATDVTLRALTARTPRRTTRPRAPRR
jgi:hypothetical protein